MRENSPLCESKVFVSKTRIKDPGLRPRRWIIDTLELVLWGMSTESKDLSIYSFPYRNRCIKTTQNLLIQLYILLEFYHKTCTNCENRKREKKYSIIYLRKIPFYLCFSTGSVHPTLTSDTYNTELMFNLGSNLQTRPKIFLYLPFI